MGSNFFWALLVVINCLSYFTTAKISFTSINKKCSVKANIEKAREVLANEKQLNHKEDFEGAKTCINSIDIKAPGK